MVRILAIHAHPDDIETLAAGALAHLSRAGCDILIATLTAGECGSRDLTAEETARVRCGEAARAAAMIGADYVCVGAPDLGVFNDDLTRRKVTELVRVSAPAIVIAAAPTDYHPDHEAASALARDACFAASAPNYKSGDAAPLASIPHLYFTDPIGLRDRDGRPVVADFAADIRATFRIKQQMLRVHESQVAWLEKQHGLADATAAMEAQARRRGREFGVEYAEGFRHYRGEPFPRTPRLQELLGEALRLQV
ncbi:MAG TPA: PIG-L family deacetylase [Caulobacteraceae bacterium]|jgi:LmbE family N-acetylglucosaminyl deacetylase